MNELVLATNNTNKVREITELLALHGLGAVIIRTIGDFTQTEPVEDGGSYLANATIKAKAALMATGLPALAEDSGIEIAALDGGPGVETAPWIAALGGWAAAMHGVNDLVQGGASPQIDFRSTFVLALPDDTILSATAVCPGSFTWPPRGTAGFGHDPYFVPQPITSGFHTFIPYGENCTYAELGLAVKQRISPRAAALEQLVQQIQDQEDDRNRSDHRPQEGHA